jgi:hypothetical protein
LLRNSDDVRACGSNVTGYVYSCPLAVLWACISETGMAGIVVTVPLFLCSVLHLFSVFLLQLWNASPLVTWESAKK